MDIWRLILKTVFIFLALLRYLEGYRLGSSCAFGSRQVTEDPGCDVCYCCRFMNGDYQVVCDDNFPEMPPLPVATTSLELTSYSQIKQLRTLTRDSFPPLPRLSRLYLLNRFEDGQASVISATPDAFVNLPELTTLELIIQLDTVTSFLNSAPKLRQLSIACKNNMTEDEYEVLFRGLNLTSLTATSCNLALDHTFPSDIVPGKLEFIRLPPPTAPRNLNLSGSQVKIRCDGVQPCLNFGSVDAKSLSFYMKPNDLDNMIIMNSTSNTVMMKNSTKKLLDWMGSTTTNVSINMIGVPDYHLMTLLNLLFGHHFHSLDIRFDVSVLDARYFVQVLSVILKYTSVRHLVLESLFSNKPEFIDAGFLQQLNSGSELKELKLIGFPIGRIDGTFQFNVTKFVCDQCKIECTFCRFTESLRQLRLYNDGSRFQIDFQDMLSTHPYLEELLIFDNDFGTEFGPPLSLSLPSHHHLRRLAIEGTTSTSIITSGLDVSKLSNLQQLVFRRGGFTCGEGAQLLLSHLQKLDTIDFSFNFYHCTRNTSMKTMFAGLDSLKTLSLAGQVVQPFWRSVEGLQDLLYPVSSTLEFLDISENKIDYLPPDIFRYMHKLMRLDLSRTGLSTLDGCAFRRNIALSQLRLEYNKIEVISSESVTCLSQLAYLQELGLKENRLRCVCENRKFRDWILNTGTKSTYPEACPSTDVKFIDFAIPWLECDFHKESLALGGSALALLLMPIAAYVIYYFRFDILFWWVIKRRHKVNRQHNIHPSREFHAFLSYSSSEQDLAHSMFFELEDGKDVQFKIAYDCRDFLPLYDIADNIIRCINRSEKVIFLISRRFLEREWCQFEMNFAQMRCFDERKNLIILIFVEEMKMKELPQRIQVLCRHVNYLEYPDKADKRAVQNFWHRLRLALTEDSELGTGEGNCTDREVQEGLDNEVFRDLEDEDENYV